MARPAHARSLVAALASAVACLVSCGGDVQNAAPPANRPASTGTFSSGGPITSSGAGGTFDTTGFGGYGGDFGTGGGFDDDGAAGTGGAGTGGAGTGDADRCASGATDEYELSDLNWIGTPINGLGPVERDTSNGDAAAGDGRPISIGGTMFDKGLGVHANSSVTFGLGGKCKTFSAYVGADDEVSSASITFEVWVDGQRSYSSPSLVRSGQAPTFVEVDVSCASNLRLVVTDGVVDGNANDHADWGDAKVTCVSKPGGPVADASIDRGADATPDASSPIDASDDSVGVEPDASITDARIDRPADATFDRRRPF
jgi:hypothetical protein